jgi:hypothetical protein
VQQTDSTYQTTIGPAVNADTIYDDPSGFWYAQFPDLSGTYYLLTVTTNNGAQTPVRFNVG